MSDVRTLLERGVGGAMPPPYGFERMLRRRDRKRRNQRITAGVVGIAVFVAAIWIITSGEPTERNLTPGATGPTGPPDPSFPPGAGLIGLPPEGAAASTPERGELVLDFGFGHTAGDPGRFSLHLYADGRVIWEQLGYEDVPSSGVVEQRLSPLGVELLRSEVLSTGLLERDLNLTSIYGLRSGQIVVRDGDRSVRVSWGQTGPNDTPITATTAELAAEIEGLDARLEDLASWLPDSAWEDRTLRPYVPSRYTVDLVSDRLEPFGRAEILRLLPPGAVALLSPLEPTRFELDGLTGPIPYWSYPLTTEQARELASIIEGAGAETLSLSGPVYRVTPSGRSHDQVNVAFEPMLPHE